MTSSPVATGAATTNGVGPISHDAIQATHGPDPNSTVHLDVSDADLQGLRSLLDAWESRGDPTRHGDEASEKDRGAVAEGLIYGRKESSEGDQEAVKEGIYSKYIKHATDEDGELVTRWTETLNILLTFAGLQSAIVVAFILFQSPTLQPNPQDTPNYLLRQILHQLNNSTILPTDPSVNWAASTTAVRILALWYVSLGCSLLSAFGALLSKQWVMHYQSQPTWANSDTRRANLREMRYQGLTSWWFFAVIEFLPVLLQLSLLFFTVGLAAYLRTISSPIFIISGIFLGIGAAFYVLTLVSGAFFPFCPYKSPASAFCFRVVAFLVVACIYPAFLLLKAAVLRILRRRVDSEKAVSEVKKLWAASRTIQTGEMVDRGLGESFRIVQESVGVAGILCWWLTENVSRIGDGSQLKMDVVTDVIANLPAVDLVDTFHRAGSFGFWMEDLEHALGYTHSAVPRQSNILGMADILFHFVRNSPLADYVVSVGWGDNARVHDFRAVCSSIRGAWTAGNTAKQLPIPTMRWPTISVYLRYQLLEWCSGGDTKNRAEIVEELPRLLQDPRLFEDIADLANVASLAAVALVPDHIPGVHQRQQFTQEGISPHEQLFLALHRLSLHGSLTSPAPEVPGLVNSTEPITVILPLLVEAACVFMFELVDDSEPDRTLLYPFARRVRYPTLRNGQLLDALLRLLNLGVLRRDRAATSSPSGPGTKENEQEGNQDEISSIFWLISLVVCPLSGHYKALPEGLSPLSTPEGLAHLFAGYATKEGVLPFSEGPINTLRIALGLRYHQPLSDSRTSKHSQTTVSLQPRTTLPTSLLYSSPQILQQLLHDVRAAKEFGSGSGGRRALLGMIVTGRDLFLPLGTGDKHSALYEALEVCASAMKRCGSFWWWWGGSDVLVALDEFDEWDQLEEALKDAEDRLHRELDAEKQPGPSVRVLQFHPSEPDHDRATTAADP